MNDDSIKNSRTLSDGSSSNRVAVGRKEALSGRWRLYGAREFNDHETENGGLVRYWQILWRHKGTLIINMLLCTFAAFLLSRFQTPVYRSSTSLQTQELNEPSVDMSAQSNSKNTEAAMDSYIQTQIEILGSRALLGRVVEQLHLEDRLEFIEKPGRLRSWRKYLWLPPHPVTPAREYALEIIRGNLRMTAPHRSRLIKIEFSSTDPKLSADFPNTLAQAYMDQNLELWLRSTERASEWLKEQLQNLKAKLQDSEDRLQLYARASGLMFTSENDSVAEAKLKQLQDELSKAQANRVDKQSRFELLTRTPADSLPDLFDSSPLRDYQVRLTELRRQLAERSLLLAPTNYKIKELQMQIGELQSAVEDERKHITERVDNSYESAKRREQLLSQAYSRQSALVSQQSELGIQYRILKQEVDTNRRLYEAMLQKVQESSMASAMRANNIVVFDPAVEPSRPYKPNIFRTSSLGLLSGIFLGMLFVFILESADRSLKSPGDSLNYLKVPELGLIPSADGNPSLSRRLWARLPENGESSVELATWRRTGSTVAESFRAALVSILFARARGTEPRVIVLTSPGVSEGKTTTVTNLGIALARIGRRVLLIDGDMRKPRLHTIFLLPNSCGLSNLLTNSDQRHSIETLVRNTEIPGLVVLTSGPCPDSPSDLMHSPRLAELLQRCREKFDAVLIDTPPVLRLADARILGRLADAVILVCRAGTTDRNSALSATQHFVADGTPILGTILNDWKSDTTAYYDYTRAADL